MKKAKPKFERAAHGALPQDRTDLVGLVQVRVTLMNGAAPLKGNMSKSMSIRGARVSQVAKYLEEVLFGA